MTTDAAAASGGSLVTPRLSMRGAQIVTSGPDEAVVKRGLAEVRLSYPDAGALLERLRSLADDGLDEEALVAPFDIELQPQIRRLVSGLTQRGILYDVAASDPASRFWLSVAPFALNGAPALAEKSVLVVGDDPIAEGLTTALEQCGVGRVDRSSGAPSTDGWDLWCLTAADPADDGAQLRRTAARAVSLGVVGLPVWLADLLIRVGPTTHPYDTACLQCYLLRLESNDPERELHRQLRDRPGGAQSGAGFLPAMVAVAAQVGAIEAVKHLSGLPVSTIGHVIELSLVPFRSHLRRVLRVPRCPVCSGVARQGAPVVAHASQLLE